MVRKVTEGLRKVWKRFARLLALKGKNAMQPSNVYSTSVNAVLSSTFQSICSGKVYRHTLQRMGVSVYFAGTECSVG